MEKLILTDCDGVILDWLGSFEPWMIARGMRPLSSEKVKEMYNLYGKYGTTQDEMTDIIHEFNASDAMLNLAAYKDAAIEIPRLVDAGFRFVAITSLGDYGREKRICNLMDLFGDIFTEVICLPQRSCKKKVLARWKDTGMLWVEDDPDNAMDGQRLGLRGIIVDTAYNRHTGAMCIRVDENTPWGDIADLVAQIY